MEFLKLLLLSCFIVLIPRPSLANLIWTNTFDNQVYDDIYRQFQSQQCSPNSDYLDNSLFKFVTSPVRGGKLAMQHHIQNCDERSEIGIPDGVLKENQEYWIGWSYFFPTDFLKPVSGEPDRSIIQQMLYQASFRDQRDGVTLFECNGKSTRDGTLKTRGVPGSYMTLAPSGDMFDLAVTFYQGKDSEGRYIFGCKNFSIPAKLNEWEDFVMNVKPSSDSEQGFVKIWKNGKLYVNEKVALLRPGVSAMGAWKIGVYVGDPGHGERLLYTDELRVGNGNSSFEEVSPGD
jgi:hypothetical protein